MSASPSRPAKTKPAVSQQHGDDGSGGAREAKPDTYLLRLYVAGKTPRSVAAIANLKKICADHLAEHFQLEVIDLLEHPQLARDDQILAIPTLVKKLPPPMRRLIGDLSNTERVLVGLDLFPRAQVQPTSTQKK